MNTDLACSKHEAITYQTEKTKSINSPVAKPILPIVNQEVVTFARFFLIETHSLRLFEYVELCWNVTIALSEKVALLSHPHADVPHSLVVT